MQSNYSKQDIHAQLKNVWLPQAEQFLQEKADQKADQLREILSQTLTSIRNEAVDAGLRSAVEKLKDKNSPPEDAQPEWPRKVSEWCQEIDIEVVLEQEEDRFTALANDSLWIKGAKGSKRAFRNIRGGLNALSNGVRSLVGKPKKELTAKTHRVPLRNIVQMNVLPLWEINKGWENNFNKLRTEVILEAIAWRLHSAGPVAAESDSAEDGDNEGVKNEISEKTINPTHEDLVRFFEEEIAHLDQLLGDFKQQISKAIIRTEAHIHQLISTVGTVEATAKAFESSKLFAAIHKLEEEEDKRQKVWNSLFSALAVRFNTAESFTRLHGQVQERISGFNASFREFFETELEAPAQKLTDLLSEVVAVFEKWEGKDETLSAKEMRKVSAEHQRKMAECIEKELLIPLRNFAEEAVLSTKMDRFTAAIPDWTASQPEKTILIDELDLTQFPPAIDFEEVNWQQLVRRVMNNQIAKKFIPKEIKAEQFLQQIIRGLEEVDEIIYANLEVADEVKKSDDEQSVDVAKEGLARALAKLEALREQVQEKKEELEHKLNTQQQAAFQKLAALLEKQDVSQIKLVGAEEMAKEKAKGWQAEAQSYWSEMAEKIELFARFFWKKLKQYVDIIRRFLGFQKKEVLEADTTDLATFLSETDEQIAALPFIYRRLFDFSKEVEARFYVRRTEQFERLKKGYALWQNEFPSVFAVVGEKGSGKSLFTKLLKDEVLTGHSLVEINFEDTIWTSQKLVELISGALNIQEAESMEDLIAAIKRKRKRQVIVLENIQNCYIRDMSGFDAIEQLLLLISETNEQMLWIASSTRYGWLYLDKVLNIAEYFTHTVETDKLGEEQIKELIMKRHRASGYQLKFLAEKSVQSSRSFKKLADDEEKAQQYLQDNFFEKLAKLAEGNSSIAMIFWLRSIKEHDDTYFYINPFDFSTVNRIENLENSDLFALAAFVLHDALQISELSKILRLSPHNTKLMVLRLQARAILQKTEHGFMLNQLIYRQVVRVLKEANFIH